MQVSFPALTDAEARNFLGGFGFQGDQALQQAATLSGGERARLALALIVQSKPNLLLLDEPTNHLDISMRQALADALVSFEGALLVISHDRTMLRTVVDELWLVANRGLRRFDDDLDGYARWLAENRQQSLVDAATCTETDGSSVTKDLSVRQVVSASTEKLSANRRQKKRDEAQRRASLAPLSKRVTSSEKALDKATAELSAIRARLSDEGMYNEENKAELTRLLSEEVKARAEVDRAEDELLENMEALELARNAISD